MGSNEVLSTLPGTESLVMVIMTVMKVKVKSLSHVQLFATPWAVAYHAPPSMGFSRQEYWSGLPFIGASVLMEFVAQYGGTLKGSDFPT